MALVTRAFVDKSHAPISGMTRRNLDGLNDFAQSSYSVILHFES